MVLRKPIRFIPSLCALYRAFCAAVVLVPLPAWGGSAEHCVVVVLPSGGWGDLPPALCSALQSVARDGAAGSLSCAVPRPMTEAAGWVTLGAGNRGVWPETLVPDSSHTTDAPPPGLVRALQDANSHLAYPIEVCSVAESLHQAGLRTALLGARRPYHWAAAVDLSGHTDYAARDASTAEIRRALHEADYIVINAAATESADGMASLVDRCGGLLSFGDLLIVAALAPRDAPFVGLAPIVVRGPGSEGGAVISATTRRPGVVANIDLAPTVLTFFGLPLPPSYQNGAPIGQHPWAGFGVEAAARLDARGRQADAYRPVAIPVLFVLQVLLVPACLVASWPRRRWLRARLMLFLMCLAPATYIVAALPAHWAPVALLLATLGLACAVAAVWPLGCRTEGASDTEPAAAIAGAMTAVLALDVLDGAQLQAIAPIGYSLGFGGRFYGIGNEAAGLLIAAAALFAAELASTAVMRRLSRVGSALLPVAVVVVIAPPLGSNAGCTLAAMVCFGVLLSLRWGRRRGWLCGLVVGAVALLLFVLAAHFDASRGPEGMTHIGRAWSRLGAEGQHYVAELITRKATSSWQALVQTPASLIAAAWVIFWSYALLRPVAFVRRAYERAPVLRAPLAAIAIGGVVAALLNDSTVAIPTMMLSIALPALGAAAAIDRPVQPEEQEPPPDG